MRKQYVKFEPSKRNDSRDNGEPRIVDNKHVGECFAIEKNRNALLCWFVEEFVPAIELLDENLIRRGVMHVLNKFMGYRYKNITELLVPSGTRILIFEAPIHTKLLNHDKIVLHKIGVS
ncbi:hypothetical protein FQA39_LY14174 [Lamprigera yunnana]|nr:hypothetical protein FQA39_LY14174 [Lamprigera yunnana]